VLRADEIRPTGGAEQQGAPGEDALHPAALLHHVRQVVGRVARRVEHPHGQLAGPHRVAVAHRRAVERHPVVGRHQVVRAGTAGELETAGHVVVVDVGLGDDGEPHAVPP
jgi:hypothetical protein